MANQKYSMDDLIVESANKKVQRRGSRCYIYTRVSTVKQVEEGHSLEAQYQYLKDYAEFEGMTVVDHYSDEGVSGKSAETRKEFMRMMEDIRSNKDDVQFVLVFKLSRFGRNVRDILAYLEDMQDYGVNLICAEDHLDSGADMGKVMFPVLAAVAELERENILVQSMNGRRGRVKDGFWVGGIAPYGYQIEKDGKDSKMVIDEEQAAIVRLIYDKYIKTNLGADGVARWLNEHGYKKTPPNVLKKHSNRKIDFLTEFSREHIVRILDNEFYMGKLAYGKRKNYMVKGMRGVTVTRMQDEYDVYEGQHDGIVSEETWQLAHEKRLATMGKSEKKDKDHEYILSTLLRCPECGSPLYGAVNRTKKRADGTPYDPYYYYKCKHQFGQTGHSCSFKTQIGARKIDQEVRDIIMSLVASDKFKSAVYAKIGEAVDVDDIQKEIDALAKKKRKIENALKMRSIEKDNLNYDDKHYERKYLEISDAMERLYDELVVVEDDIDDKKSCIRSVEQNKVSQDKIYNLLIKFSDIYDKMKDQEKKELMALFIDKIEIHKQKQSDGRRVKQIDFHFPVVIGDGEECNSIFPSFPDECGDNRTAIKNIKV